MTGSDSRNGGGEVGLWADLLGITESRESATPPPAAPPDPKRTVFDAPDAGLPVSRPTPFEEWIRLETAGGAVAVEAPTPAASETLPVTAIPSPASFPAISPHVTEEPPGHDPTVLRAECLQYQNEIAAACHELRIRREEIEELERHRHTLRIESTAMRERLARDQDSVGQLADERAALEYDLEGLRTELARRRAEMTATFEAVRSRRAEVEALERQAGDLAEGIVAARNAQHQLNLMREEANGLELQLQALKDELIQLREERARVQEDIQARRTEFAAIYNHDRKVLDKIKREIAITQQQDKARTDKHQPKPVPSK
jgi:septal ring factor EnvC (AmiA/AmiB activator)